MIIIGIYPGTFDPITNGHIDVIKRSLKIVNKLIVAVSNDYSKDYLFSSEERVSIIRNSLFKDLKFIKYKKSSLRFQYKPSFSLFIKTAYLAMVNFNNFTSNQPWIRSLNIFLPTLVKNFLRPSATFSPNI